MSSTPPSIADPRLTAQFRSVSSALGIVAGGLGVATMQSSIALSFLFSGLGLVLVREPMSARRIQGGLACAAAVLLISGLAMAESRITAFHFGCIGGALAALAVSRRNTLWGGLCLAQALALLCFVDALFGLSERLYLVEAHDVFKAISTRAILGFLALALGLLFARPEHGLLRNLTSDTLSGGLARRLLPLTLLIPFALSSLRLLGEDAGLYSANFGMALHVVASAVCLTGLTWWITGLLPRWELRHRRVQEALRESENLLRRVVETMPDGLFIYQTKDQPLFANAAAERILGWPRAEFEETEFCQRPWKRSTLDGQPVPGELRASSQVLKTGEPVFGLRMRVLRQDGQWTPIEVNASPLRDAETNEITGVVSTFADISKKLAAEEALEERARLAALSADVGTALIREDSLQEMLRRCAEAVVEHLGVTCACAWTLDEEQTTPELQAKAGLNADPADLREHLRVAQRKIDSIVRERRPSLTNTLLEDPEIDREWALREGMVAFAGYPLIARDRFVGILGMFSRTPIPEATLGALEAIGANIALGIERERVWQELAATQRKILQAQRLEAAGRIASQVAHDFNNLLSPLLGYPGLIKRMLPPGHPALRPCDAMEAAARKMSEINGDLLTLGRAAHYNPEPVDLNHVAEQAAQLLAERPPTLELVLERAEDLLPVEGSEAQLLRVLSNLVANARDAMGDQGVLTLRTTNVPETDSVQIEVSDTGSGIAPEDRERIFDLYFTTKRASHKSGSGLGLSIVRAIVESHRGEVQVRSEPGRGSTFTVRLPMSREARTRERSEEARGGSERILVVDNDSAHRKLIEEMLGTLGYAVAAAASGEAALETLREWTADLVVLDMKMESGIDGTETYRRMLQLRPGQRAILLSGFAEPDRVLEAKKLGVGAYLQKPVALRELARAIRAELDRGRTADARLQNG